MEESGEPGDKAHQTETGRHRNGGGVDRLSLCCCCLPTLTNLI